MKNKIPLLIGVFIVLLVITGVVIYKALMTPGNDQVAQIEEVTSENYEPLNSKVIVDIKAISSKPNTLLLSVSGLAGTAKNVAYELSYESQGLVKGVNSGSKPIDVAGEDSFEREVYLGTCSRNVCKPDVGVKSVSVVLEFTNTSGKKSQYTNDFDL